jgi:hypothetical protein
MFSSQNSTIGRYWRFERSHACTCRHKKTLAFCESFLKVFQGKTRKVHTQLTCDRKCVKYLCNVSFINLKEVHYFLMSWELVIIIVVNYVNKANVLDLNFSSASYSWQLSVCWYPQQCCNCFAYANYIRHAVPKTWLILLHILHIIL